MARKPHNYAHFQNLVNELKEQNAGNTASLQQHLEIQTDVLQSMKGFMLKGLQADADELRKDREKELEGGKKGKGLTGKSKLDLPRFSGKGFMGMLGNFLSTALLGIPGGLRKFLPRSLGMALLPKLARGIALLVAGPALIEALKAGFDQDTFTGGVTAFIDSYFAPRGGPYQSLAKAAMGTAGKGALIGFALGGPKGAIIAGILSGALGGLNYVFGEDKGKMNSKGVMDKMKEFLLKNVGIIAGATGGYIGMKALMPLGPAAMIAGGIVGAGIGMLGAGAFREMMKLEEGGEKDLGVAFRQGLKNYYMKIDWGSGAGAAGAGALFFSMIGAKAGPHGMLAGALLGAGVGLLAGPILSEALRIDKKEGKGMASAMKTATWNYIKKQAKNRYVTSALAGATAGGILGSVGTLPGMIAGTIIGAIFGIIVQWLTDTIGTFAGEQFAKAFGIEEVLSEEEKKYREAKEKYGRKGTFTDKLLTAKSKSSFSGRQLAGIKQGVNDPFTVMQKLKEEYLKITGTPWLTGNFDLPAAQKAAIAVKSVGEKRGDWDRVNEEAMAIKLMQMRDRTTSHQAYEARNQPTSTAVLNDSTVINNTTSITPQQDYVTFEEGLIERMN